LLQAVEPLFAVWTPKSWILCILLSIISDCDLFCFFLMFFLCLGPVEELEVLQPTCATVDSRLLSSTKSKDIEGHRNAFEMHDTSWISRIAEPHPVESK
jgi:hypothetical protein